MGTEVLRPQDCLIRPIPSFRKPNPNPNPNPNPRQKKRREGSPRPKNQMVMGHVTILKRGESLATKTMKEEEKTPPNSDPPVFGPDPLGPDPVLVPKQIRIGSGRIGDMYAGSAFWTSPSPRKVPLPSFSKRKEVEATQDLRRLLRLE